MQNWFCVDAAAGRLEPESEAEVLEIIIVSDAVEGTFVNLDCKSLQEEQEGKYQREWKRSKGVDRTEMRKEENNLRCAWSTERKYMRRYKGTFDVSQIEEGGNGGTVQQRGQGEIEVCG